jgi:A/G-specific adenine glycosylase
MAASSSRVSPAVGPLVSGLLAWFARCARDLPWRRTRDPYAIWVSEIMLQQTQVKTVIPYWERWMREFPNAAAVTRAHPERLHKMWAGLGYYTRVRNLQRAAQVIVAEHGGQFPREITALRALPGIGRYTAGAIASIAFDEPRPILDGNVIRVLTRVFGIAADPRTPQVNARLWDLAEQLVSHAHRLATPPTPCSHLNQSLMELGALVCTPRSPRCAKCPVRDGCVAFRSGLQDKLPRRPARIPATARQYQAFVIERRGRLLVWQRPASVVNAQLWEFPAVEIPPGRSGRPSAHRPPPGVRLIAGPPLCVIKHCITRYRMTVTAWRAELIGASDTAPRVFPAARWKSRAQLAQLAFTSAHQRILQRALAQPLGA